MATTFSFGVTDQHGRGNGTLIEATRGHEHVVTHRQDMARVLRESDVPLHEVAIVHLTRDHQPLMVVWGGVGYNVTHG